MLLVIEVKRSNSMTQTVNAIDWDVVNDEVVNHLRAILQLDTRNPPGNEIRAAEYIAQVLEREGIPYEIVGPSPDRATIVARGSKTVISGLSPVRAGEVAELLNERIGRRTLHSR